MTGAEGAADADENVTYRELDTDGKPGVAVVRTVAELDGVDPAALPDLYSTVDHLLDRVFSNPPSPDAQARIEFTYAGYRIAVNQDGRASFRKVDR